MNIKTINGTMFEKMVRNGLANLRNHEQKINKMNVFPVTDGDTGTNMRLTLENGIKTATSSTNLAKYLKDLSDGMLLGARGNSGVILSQIFRGFYLELNRCSIANVGELRDAFTLGYKTAYKVVRRPVEGTILTVSREGIENIRSQIKGDIKIPGLFSMYLAQMRKTLAQTPEMLPVLKEAGVVDSGGLGYITIIEGMEMALYGEVIDSQTYLPKSKENESYVVNKFTKDSHFSLGYCMEFILQILTEKHPKNAYNQEEFSQNIAKFGDSVVVVTNNDIVKVHIHTKIPSKIIEYSQNYGEFVSFKLENMQLQHDELIATQKVQKIKKPLAIIAISNGEGVSEVFRSFNCDAVIDGGLTMNTSTQEILDKIKIFDAEEIVIFPNNVNIHKSCEQAVMLSKLNNIEIIPTKDVLECYYALAMDILNEDIKTRIENMKRNALIISCVQVTKCAKDCVVNGIKCIKGSYVLLHDGNAIASIDDIHQVFAKIHELNLFKDKETCFIFTGIEKNTYDVSEIESQFEMYFEDLEYSIIDGKQRIYNLIIGAV